MIVTPYKRRPEPPQVGLLLPSGGVLDEHGRVHQPRRRPPELATWAHLETVNGLLREGKGRALCWQGQPIKYNPAGVAGGYDVRVLDLPVPADPDEAIGGLARWRDWLAYQGASPLGSLGSTSMSLLKASLAAPLHTSVPFSSCPPVRFTIGGRQELGPLGAPAEYHGRLRHFDLRAAYASLLGSLEYGGHWFKLHSGKVAEHADLFDRGGRMVFARARVRLDGRAPGPLVRRPRSDPGPVTFGHFPEYPSAGTVQGIWTYPELRAAAEHGARVKLIAGWVQVNGSDHPRPFAPWLEKVEHGRRMQGFAGLLAKATGNALWGQFCIRPHGRRQVLYYRGQRRVLVELPSRPGRRPAHDLSEYLTGYVRAELYRFAVSAGERLCSAHTDGGWVDGSDGWTYPAWRAKGAASCLRVLDPQVLAYTDEGGVERYVVSGWPADEAAASFEERWLVARRAA